MFPWKRYTMLNVTRLTNDMWYVQLSEEQLRTYLDRTTTEPGHDWHFFNEYSYTDSYSNRSKRTKLEENYPEC